MYIAQCRRGRPMCWRRCVSEGKRKVTLTACHILGRCTTRVSRKRVRSATELGSWRCTIHVCKRWRTADGVGW